MSVKVRSSHGQFRSGQVKIKSSLDMVKSGQFKSCQITVRSDLVRSVQVMTKLGYVSSHYIMLCQMRSR